MPSLDDDRAPEVRELASTTCRICGHRARAVGTKRGNLDGRAYSIARCSECGFVFTTDPRTDFARLYDEAYYTGRGADPLVDYISEMYEPARSIRFYEWRGIVKVVGHLLPLQPGSRWLDFGCGTGGLVRYARRHLPADVVGFEDGWASKLLTETRTPVVSREELEVANGTFDLITAIEVLEHVVDPVGELRRIRSLLKPGGIFFFTTGNVERRQGRVLSWSYLQPEIHPSLFEPRTAVIALKQSGFSPEYHGFMDGYDDIIRFKILKNLRRTWRSPVEAVVPWSSVARVVDRRVGVTAHPIGRAT